MEAKTIPVFDSLDLKLLWELDTNSRQSFNGLAKKLKVNKGTVKYRVQSFLNSGIIKSFNAILDSGKLGYMSIRLGVKLYQATPEKENEIIDFLLAHKQLTWLVRVTGDWDFNTCFVFKDLQGMNAFLNVLNIKYGTFILTKQIAIFTNISYFGRAFLAGKKSNDFVFNAYSLPSPVKTDQVDQKILYLLSENARTPVVELAQKCKVTPKTIISKIKRLENEKVILGYRSEFDLAKLGYNYYKIHMNTMNMTPQKYERIKQFLFEHPSVVYHDEGIGCFDLEFEVQVRNELQRVQIEILARNHLNFIEFSRSPC
ncbi:MAG: Lrp/AsnC family transcriptional regulator [Candidatus Diapherotrites archaeon]|nr:Lrp/AsnC family transcriptional regulator [Candidatus Diapherotrites archaeon]